MARPATPRSALATAAALLIAGLTAAGCVSMPSGGPVQSYPVTEGTDAQSQQYMQVQPQPPGPGWTPKEIVEGFLTASASIGSYGQVVQQYLTPQEQKNWKKSWSAIVYKDVPAVGNPTYTHSKDPTAATVQVTGTVQAVLTSEGSYSVQSVSSQVAQSYSQNAIYLAKLGGQWRISYAPPELLLTSNSFAHDFQLQNLYFFDPTGTRLVPDPVYVPLGARPEDLVSGLVGYLIRPPKDWLSEGATKTAFPAGTTISKSNGVELSGATAVINLTGAAISKANSSTMERVSAQLLYTLRGAAQGGPNGAVQSVEVLVNGHPWVPPGSQDGGVQQDARYGPPDGASDELYYVDSSGYLTSRASTGTSSVRRLAKIGTGYSQIAVSPNGEYVAALSKTTTLYAGLIGKPLVKQGSGYVAISWDVNHDLWAAAQNGNEIVVFHATSDARQPLGHAVPVNVVPTADLYSSAPFTAIKVAPDGVRIAIVQDDIMTFGAISGRLGSHPQIRLSTVQDSASSSANFTALAWYGSDSVITLATPGPAVAEYSVSGGGPVPIPADSGMLTITASSGQPLVAGLPKGQLAFNASTTGSWMPLTPGGAAPAYPG